MSPIDIFLISITIAIIGLILGIVLGFKLHSPKIVGTLLVVRDLMDGDTYMQLEIAKGKADEIYDKNEITLNVIEIIGPDKTAK